MKGRRRFLAAVMTAGFLAGGCASGTPLPFDNQGTNDFRAANGVPPYLGKGPVLIEDHGPPREAGAGDFVPLLPIGEVFLRICVGF